MSIRQRFLALAALACGVLAFALLWAPGGTTAASQTSGGITVTWPDYTFGSPALTCTPNDTITISGATGMTVEVRFGYDHVSGGVVFTPWVTYPDVSGDLVVPVPYPPLSEWPTADDGSLLLGIAAQVVATGDDGTIITVATNKWWIKCVQAQPTETPTNTPVPPTETPTNTPVPPTATPTNTPVPPTATATPQTGGQGCTPGYWRQPHHYDSWVGYSPSDDFEVVFGVDASFNPTHLGYAVTLGGGGENALARHAVAALLNASSPEVNFAYSVSQVISMVQDAYATGDFETAKDLFDAANNAGCPLD